MNIQIELVVFLFIIGVVILWSILMFVHKKIKIWRYKPENDKSRRAEENRRSGLADLQRPVLSQRRSVFPSADFSSLRQDSNSDREERRGNGNSSNPFLKKMM